MTAGQSAGRVRLLFSTPLIIDEVAQAAEVAAALEQLILSKRREHPGAKLSNRGGWQSTHDFASWSGEGGRTIIDRALGLATAHTLAPGGSAPRWTV